MRIAREKDEKKERREEQRDRQKKCDRKKQRGEQKKHGGSVRNARPLGAKSSARFPFLSFPFLPFPFRSSLFFSSFYFIILHPFPHMKIHLSRLILSVRLLGRSLSGCSLLLATRFHPPTHQDLSCIASNAMKKREKSWRSVTINKLDRRHFKNKGIQFSMHKRKKTMQTLIVAQRF
mmetsp:Transcript_30292/g.59530  ORF Transcript_30292/g.59530 Transcript_30292/m.59530 type:complete len:177 (-) Transcript_30292:441-971(-)